MKGQVWSIDLAISSLIFIMVVIFVFFIWSNISDDTEEQNELRMMESLALSISDSLIRVPGIPANWNSSTVRVVGFAEDCGIFCENVLNMTKLKHFKNVSYSQSKSLLRIMNNEYFISVKDMDNNIIESEGVNLTFGLYPPTNSTVIVPVERFTMIDNNLTTFVLLIWK